MMIEGIIVRPMASKRKNTTIGPKAVESFVHSLFAEDIHAKRDQSLANAVTGGITAGALGVHGIGRGLASAKGLMERHTVKQVDPLVGNRKAEIVVGIRKYRERMRARFTRTRHEAIKSIKTGF